MKRRLPVGLIIEGNVTNSTVLRLPNLPEEAGPVKSSSLRVARRASGFLRAGFAVSSYSELQDSRLVLVRAPDEAISRIIDEILASSLNLKHLAFAFCETWLSSSHLSALSEQGASVATAIQVPGARRKWFVVEGALPAAKQIRRLLEGGDASVLQLKSNTKHLYFAAEALTTALPAPLFWMAQQSLRQAGLSGNHLQALLEEFMSKMLRDFAKGGRSSWSGPALACTPEIVSSHFQNLRRTNPQVAGLLARHFGAGDGPTSTGKLNVRRSATLK